MDLYIHVPDAPLGLYIEGYEDESSWDDELKFYSQLVIDDIWNYSSYSSKGEFYSVVSHLPQNNVTYWGITPFQSTIDSSIIKWLVFDATYEGHRWREWSFTEHCPFGEKIDVVEI